MPLRKLQQFLDEQHVEYTVINHRPVYTAQEIAAIAHIPGKQLAKTVIIKLDGNLAMAVLPASSRVDLKLLKEASGANVVELAGEKEFAQLFPECETGAMPPFGNLFGMRVFVAAKLAEDKEIAFNAGSFSELVRLSFSDYQKLVHPTVARFAITD